MKTLYLLFFGVSVCFSTSAQTGSLSGKIQTSDNQPAAFVNIQLKEINKGTTSSENGSYSIKSIAPGSYTLITSAMGLESQQQTIQIVAGENTSANFQLKENALQLGEIVINDSRTLNEKSLTIGKAGIKPMDLPQSVVVIDSKVLEQQQTQRVSDVLKNVNGVYTMGTTGGTQEEIAGRGFAFGSNNTFKNGVRFNNGVMPETSALESVEVLKGSNAILFGNVAAGGVLNLVTKKPKFENGGELSFRLGSFNFYKPSLDIYGAVNNSKHVAYRLNTTYENAGSFRDQVNSERFYINPSFLIKAGDKTTILIESDYLKDTRTPDYGIGAFKYTILDVPRDRFLGVSWANYETIQKNLSTTVTHQINDRWQIRAVAGVQGYENELYATARPTAFAKDDSTRLNRTLQRTSTDETYFLGQVDLTGNFKTGSIKHTILFGADYDAYKTASYAYNIYALQNYPDSVSAVYDVINPFDLTQHEQRGDVPRVSVRQRTETPITRAGICFQDLISLSEKVKVLAGIRYSYMETGSKAYTYVNGQPELNATQAPKRFDDAFSPRFGVVYQPLKTTSVFASYANSFVLNSGRDINFNALPPSVLDQFEVGVKNDFFNGFLSVNVTAYQIVNSDFTQSVYPQPASPLNPSAQEIAGEVTSKGIEVDLMTKPFKGLSVIGGYSYNETRITASKNDFYEVGSKLRYNPAHTANTSIYYNFPSQSFLKGLNLGVTGFIVADMMAGRSTTKINTAYKLIALPDFFLLEVGAGYVYQNVSVRVRVNNLLNEPGYYAHDDNSINPIAPRQFLTTVAYKF
jgi:iron complex outermembrane receptor protein